MAGPHRVRDLIRWLKNYDPDELIAFAEELSDRFTYDFELKYILVEHDDYSEGQVLAFVTKDFDL